ncbi:hypothetical protein [Clostridium formicaceticum]|uniref:hypothetical protein n=1 Tax=Clostridium formicaceticum TaxID=1497 RepID=UPI0012EA5A90|nr:hypothetical protein [Clostridium formicaceticum]
MSAAKGIATPMNFWDNTHAALLQFADWICKHTVRVVADTYFSNKSFRFIHLAAVVYSVGKIVLLKHSNSS